MATDKKFIGSNKILQSNNMLFTSNKHVILILKCQLFLLPKQQNPLFMLVIINLLKIAHCINNFGLQFISFSKLNSLITDNTDTKQNNLVKI